MEGPSFWRFWGTQFARGTGQPFLGVPSSNFQEVYMFGRQVLLPKPVVNQFGRESKRHGFKFRPVFRGDQNKNWATWKSLESTKCKESGRSSDQKVDLTMVQNPVYLNITYPKMVPKRFRPTAIWSASRSLPQPLAIASLRAAPMSPSTQRRAARGLGGATGGFAPFFGNPRPRVFLIVSVFPRMIVGVKADL